MKKFIALFGFALLVGCSTTNQDIELARSQYIGANPVQCYFEYLMNDGISENPPYGKAQNTTSLPNQGICFGSNEGLVLKKSAHGLALGQNAEGPFQVIPRSQIISYEKIIKTDKSWTGSVKMTTQIQAHLSDGVIIFHRLDQSISGGLVIGGSRNFGDPSESIVAIFKMLKVAETVGGAYISPDRNVIDEPYYIYIPAGGYK
jgi:hypothetical protein